MCFSKPKAPAAPVAPPPPAPLAPPVLGKPEDDEDQLSKRKKLGYSRLQIPLAAPSASAAGGLSIPT
jgi:hypothetical protein